jgi:hypothetical protein
MPAPVIKVVIYLASRVLSSNVVEFGARDTVCCIQQDEDSIRLIQAVGVVHRGVVRHTPGKLEAFDYNKRARPPTAA